MCVCIKEIIILRIVLIIIWEIYGFKTKITLILKSIMIIWKSFMLFNDVFLICSLSIDYKIIADNKIGKVWMSISCITHLCQKKWELEGKTDSKKDVEAKPQICNCDLVISKVWSSILILVDCFCLAVCALFA